MFEYVDTNSSRAGIVEVQGKLAGFKIAIVGLGGSGSYVLDLVAKTPVAEIHLFDDDVFSQHNAFRAPGAASVEELRQKPKKVEYFAKKYSAMRRGIVAHDYRVTQHNAGELSGFDFVFLCQDSTNDKEALLQSLNAAEVSYVDIGMGVELVDGALLGIVRTTTASRSKRDHVFGQGRIPVGMQVEDEYRTNIQIADLNALNAAMAVIKWKKIVGFYHDEEREHFSTYTLNVNMLLSEDTP